MLRRRRLKNNRAHANTRARRCLDCIAWRESWTGKESAEKPGKIAAAEPPSGRTISISRGAMRSPFREKRFTSNLFLSFRGNRSPITLSSSFPSSRSLRRSARPYVSRETCSETLPPRTVLSVLVALHLCFLGAATRTNPLCASRFPSTNRRRAAVTSTPRRFPPLPPPKWLRNHASIRQPVQNKRAG